MSAEICPEMRVCCDFQKSVHMLPFSQQNVICAATISTDLHIPKNWPYMRLQPPPGSWLEIFLHRPQKNEIFLHTVHSSNISALARSKVFFNAETS